MILRFILGMILYVAAGEGLLLTLIFWPMIGYSLGLVLGIVLAHAIVKFNRGVYQ